MANFFSESTGLYFFSATLQANAALLSVFAIFVIFRIQQLESTISAISTLLLNDRGTHLIVVKDALRFLEAHMEERKKLANSYVRDLQILAKKWIQAKEQADSVARSLRAPTIFLAVLMAVDLFGMLFASAIHATGTGFEAAVLGILAVLNSAAMIQLGMRIISTVESQ